MANPILKVSAGRRLDDLTNAREPLRIIIIGPPKTGKSVALSTAPKPLLVLSTEGGMQSSLGTPDTVEYRVSGWNEVKAWYEELRDNPDPLAPWGIKGRPKSVGWDSATELYAGPLMSHCVHDYKRTANQDPDIPDRGDYMRAQQLMLDAYRLYRTLPMHIVMTSELGIDKDEATSKTTYTASFAGKMDYKVPYAMDWVMFLSTKSTSGKPPSRVGLVGAVPGYVAGNRIPYQVADVMPREIENPTIPKLLGYLDEGYKRLEEKLRKNGEPTA